MKVRGDVVRAARERRFLSLYQAARAARVDWRTWKLLEEDPGHRVEMPTLKKVCLYLGLPIEAVKVPESQDTAERGIPSGRPGPGGRGTSSGSCTCEDPAEDRPCPVHEGGP